MNILYTIETVIQMTMLLPTPMFVHLSCMGVTLESTEPYRVSRSQIPPLFNICAITIDGMLAVGEGKKEIWEEGVCYVERALSSRDISLTRCSSSESCFIGVDSQHDCTWRIKIGGACVTFTVHA